MNREQAARQRPSGGPLSFAQLRATQRGESGVKDDTAKAAAATPAAGDATQTTASGVKGDTTKGVVTLAQSPNALLLVQEDAKAQGPSIPKSEFHASLFSAKGGPGKISP